MAAVIGAFFRDSAAVAEDMEEPPAVSRPLAFEVLFESGAEGYRILPDSGGGGEDDSRPQNEVVPPLRGRGRE